MKEPISKVDVRFSDRDAVATSWEVTRSVLETAELFWITTVRGNGRPHVTPLVAVWSEEALYVSMGIDERKTLNLRRNAHVVLTTGCNDWDRGLDVVVEGEADQVIDRLRPADRTVAAKILAAQFVERCAASASARPSCAPSMLTYPMRLRASLAASPAPGGPMWSTRQLTASRTGRNRSISSSEPPIMQTSSPAAEASGPPLTPQSTTVMPRVDPSARISSTVSVGMVLTMTAVVPAAAPAKTPSGPCRTARTWASLKTTTSTTSLRAANSEGVAAT